MRVALISDIHANAVALDAALSHLHQDRVDEVVCLGDVAQGGPQPAEAVDRLRALECRVVLGNADAFLLDPDASREPATARHLEVRAWTLERLGEERLEYLRTFEPTVEMELGPGRSLLCFHGSPASYDDVVL
ncbi:MAG: metallophosphatase family protein, partial [Actinomycetota bacterium]|nr:metallophosphatase family protein [Actinomycetota bacterium]